MTDKKILGQLHALFLEKISEKNSWRKNEVVDLWNRCLTQVLLDKLQ